MLTQIEVQPGQYVRYKSAEPVPPGLYYFTRQRFDGPAAKKLKSAIAATPVERKGGGGFMWLVPYERWVKRIVEGYVPPEVAGYDVGGTTAAPENALHIEHCWEKLRPWQKQFCTQAIVSLSRLGYYRRGWIAPLGAGKTLAGLCALNNFERPLVIAPPSLHATWAEEATKWGLTCPRFTTYQSAHKYLEADAVVMDEVLDAMNPLTKNHRNVLAASAKADLVVGFTGTPSSVNPMNLRWLRGVSPGSVPEQETAWRFLWGLDTELVEVAPERQAYVTKTWDLDAISRFTAPYLAAVPLDEIKKDLPEIEFRKIEVPQPARFKMIVKGVGTEHGKAKAVAQARQLSDGFVYDDAGQAIDVNTDKIDAVDRLVRDSEEPFVIAAAWDQTIRRLAERFKDLAPAVMSGSTGEYGSEEARFKKGETRLVIVNSRISKGFNWQRARLMIIVSNSLSPVHRKQLIGRIYRPGQAAAGVVIYDIVAKDTLDEPALKLLDEHTEQSEAFVEAALAREMEKIK